MVQLLPLKGAYKASDDVCPNVPAPVLHSLKGAYKASDDVCPNIPAPVLRNDLSWNSAYIYNNVFIECDVTVRPFE